MTPPATPAPELGVSVVMVSFHTGPDLFDALDAVWAQPEVIELILVDNGNPESVRRQLHGLAVTEPRLVLETGQGNIGFARGCNLGARRARGRHLLLVNPDCHLPAGAVATLLVEGSLKQRPWLIGPRLLGSDGREQAGSRRRTLTPWNACVEIFRLYRLVPGHPAFQRFNLHTELLPDRTESVEVISGACMLLTTEDYWALGGMDEGFFLHVEDIDFCVRFAQHGGVYFCPAVQVHHRKGTSVASATVVEWHKTRGFFRYFRKHFSGRYPFGVITLVDLAIFLRFLLVAVAKGVKRSISGLGGLRAMV